MALQAENAAMRQSIHNGPGSNASAQPNHNDNILDRIDPEMVEALNSERKKRQDVERELELQVTFVTFSFCWLSH